MRSKYAIYKFKRTYCKFCHDNLIIQNSQYIHPKEEFIYR